MSLCDGAHNQVILISHKKNIVEINSIGGILKVVRAVANMAECCKSHNRDYA